MRIAVIPDAQNKHGINMDHLAWCGKYLAEKQPEVIVDIGDFADMPSLSSYDKGKKSFEGRRYKKDIESSRRGMELLLAPIQRKRRYSPRLILTLGNHEDRISRAVENDPTLEGTYSLKDLGYEEAGWKVYPYLQPVRIGGVYFSHYFPSGIMGRPCTTARKLLATYHSSCVAGHQQGLDHASSTKPSGKRITAIIAGSFYQHKESYLTPISNNHWRGIVMLHEVRDGDFDPMYVSLNYLKRRFRK